MKKLLLYLTALCITCLSYSQGDPDIDCPAPETFLAGEYQITDVMGTVGPGNATSNFAPGIITIAGNGNTRTFQSAVLPAFNTEIETINLILNCGVIQIEDVNPSLQCNGVDPYIFTTTDVPNSTPYSIVDGDASFVINYIEDPEGSCGGPFNSSFSLTKQCSEPQNVSFSNATDTTVDLNWTDTNNTSLTTNTYTIEYGLQGFTVGSGQTVTGISSTTATINNLVTNTAYDFYIFGSCSGSTSAIAGPFEYGNFVNSDFLLDNNGVTCLCPDANFGDVGTLTINGETKTFTKRTETELRDLVAADVTDPQIALTCTSGINNMSILFENTTFNQNLENWDTSSVTNMNSMFAQAFLFNQPLNSWNVSQVTYMGRMLGSANAFNQPLDNWDVSNVTDMSFMFIFAGAFDQPLNNWDVSNVTTMRQMLPGSSFNQPLDNWDVSLVSNMQAMFTLTPFNQPIGNWDVSNVTDMDIMFRDATSFNQDLSNWSFNEEVGLFGFLNNSGLDSDNYDALLQTFDAQNLIGLTLGAESIVYCDEATRSNLINTKNWTITGDFLGQCGETINPATTPFVTTWTVQNDLSIDIYTSNGFDYDFTVDWGDGQTDQNATADITHNYANPGTYTVNITGVFPYFKTCEGQGGTNCAKLSSVEAWGNQEWRLMIGSFNGATNFNINTTEIPDLSNVTNMKRMFQGASSFNQNINSWDVSQVTDMSYVFNNAVSFNEPLDTWDTTNITNMRDMFNGAITFNQPLNNWDVGNVTNMIGVFAGNNGSNFNQPLDQWDTSNVTDMRFMFFENSSFNQSLNNWDVSQVTNMSVMFADASSFNQPLNDWFTSNVTNTSNMFLRAVSFNQPLSSWDTSNVTFMSSMFAGATAFNQALNNWDVSNVIFMNTMFSGATSFNQSLNNWSPSNVINMASMFVDATSFDQTLDNWNVSSVEFMSGMFANAASFNQSLNSWNTSNVTDMNTMFLNATSFNQPLDNWDVSQVTNMSFMFSNASSFNQDISVWCVEQIPAEPTDFALNTALQTSFFPDWGAVCEPLSINEDNFTTLKVYPNPVKNWLNINFGSSNQQVITITDVNGKIILNQKNASNLLALDVSTLSNGLYFLNISSEGKNQVKKFIKQ